ncbi:alpha-amylase family glycosyl hydrolase [Halanaerobacter jeridensis]|uniref:Glycosidase n=1 Tax=Halanaerobacter jeridensis TaxID=706427 RepID=A0A939BMS8_9FIRM|nr:alpha-amylase family glycosyl hydrolase [Halanaerobacter jeridensis]MBM7557360.1 glycosidase [Halanaerobacter jeridensis]
MKCLKRKSKLLVLGLVLTLLVVGCSSEDETKVKNLLVQVTAPNDSAVTKLDISFPHHDDISSKIATVSEVGEKIGFEFKKLRIARTYEVKILAKNSNDEAIYGITKEVDVANTTELDVKLTTDDQLQGLTVDITAPGYNEVTQLEVQFPNNSNISAQEKQVTNPGQNISFEFAKLTNGMDYEIRLIAKNSSGEAVYIKNKTIDPAQRKILDVDFPAPDPLSQNKRFNKLRIYEVMVEAYQDGDSSADYGVGYGTSDHRGDIKGITEAMPYIASLNVNAIWLTPVFNSEGNDAIDATGYYADDYFAIDPKFGTEEEFRELVETAHEHGLYVLLDGVFGHYGHANEQLVSPKGNKTVAAKEINSDALGLLGYKVKYPESLNYFKEVATYWIEEYNIDGWRLDQAYQLYQNGHNYWSDIRQVVEEVAQQREQNGKQWGTLGYMVGEIWDGSGNQIANEGYGQNGLQSAFDFPVRYSLTQVLATQEDASVSWGYNQPASKLAGDYGINNRQQYPDYAQPNLMLTNHDLVRFGDLIQRAPHLGYGPENYDYWKRHKAAFSFMASYTGPITLYYGDEIGEEVEGYVNDQDSVNGEVIYDDHASRDGGEVAGFTSQEEDLKNYLSKVMTIRKNHPALWNGDYKFLTLNDDIYSVLKTDPESGEEIIYILNAGLNQTTVSNLDVEALTLEDLMTGEIIDASKNYDIQINGLSSRFLLVK